MREEREEDGKRRRTIAREGVGGGEREEEREGDMLRGLSPKPKTLEVLAYIWSEVP